MEKIILIGAGGHCKVVIDAILEAKKYRISGIIDLKEKVGEKVFGIPIIGEDSQIKSCLRKQICNCFIAAGSVGNPYLRIRLSNLAKKAGFKFPNIIHPAAVVSKLAKLGAGNFIGAGAIINAGAIVGNNCIINTNAVVEHDCKIDDFAHVSPGVTISAGVNVGRCAHIGAGSSVIQYKKIGKNSLIGAGSVVVSDIDSNIVAVGNPCRKIKDND